MKVEFSAIPVTFSAKHPHKQSRKKVGVVNNSEPLGPVVRLSFKGLAQKNKRQILSIAASDSKLGISAYMDDTSQVTKRITSNLHRNSKMDSRIILPYYSFDNPDGLLKVAKLQYDQTTGKRINSLPVNAFRTVPSDYTLEPGEKFVVQNHPVNGKSRFIELEPTGIFGKLDRIRTEALNPKDVPYTVFKSVNLPGKPDGVTRYILHTPKMAAYESAKAAEAAKDLSWNDFSKAAVNVMPKLNSKEFENFNPLSVVLHRRVSFPALFRITELSSNGNAFYNQLRIHPLMYTPNDANMGRYNNPMKFLRMVTTPGDWEEIKKLPEYNFINSVDKNFKKASREDIQKVEKILKPFLSPFKDPNGGYSLRMAAIRAAEVNPGKITLETPGKIYDVFGSGIKLPNLDTEVFINMQAEIKKSGHPLHKLSLTSDKSLILTENPFRRVIDLSGTKKLFETAQDALKAARANFWGKVITTVSFLISIGGIGTMIYLSRRNPYKSD